MVWHSCLFQNFPQFVVIHTVKGFSVVNEAEIYVFLEFPYFPYDPTDVGDLISGSSAFSYGSFSSCTVEACSMLSHSVISNSLQPHGL